jgi:hypothetical protein
MVKNGMTRQQTDEVERGMAHETNEPKTNPTAKESSPSGGTVDKHLL